MAPAHVAQNRKPVSRVGPLTTRAGVTFGLRDRKCACTASNVVRIDQGWNLDGDDLADRLQFLRLAALVELVASDIGRACQDAMNLADAPASAVAGEDTAAVEMAGDVLDPIGPPAPSPSGSSR